MLLSITNHIICTEHIMTVYSDLAKCHVSLKNTENVNNPKSLHIHIQDPTFTMGSSIPYEAIYAVTGKASTSISLLIAGGVGVTRRTHIKNITCHSCAYKKKQGAITYTANNPAPTKEIL